MTEKVSITYVADDKTVFETEKECLEIYCPIFPHIHLFEYDMQPLKACEHSDMWYIFVMPDCPQEELVRFKDYVEDDVSNIQCAGFYAYREEKEGYINLDKIREKLDTVYKKLNDFI